MVPAKKPGAQGRHIAFAVAPLAPRKYPALHATHPRLLCPTALLYVPGSQGVQLRGEVPPEPSR